MTDQPELDPTLAPGRRRLGLMMAGLLTGLGTTAGAYAAMGARVEWVTPAEPVELVHVEVGKMVLPLVDPDGDLVGYLAVDAELVLAASDETRVREELPVLQHEINLRAWKAGLAAGRDHMLLKTAEAERLYESAATKVFGRHVVKRVLLTSILPV